MEIVQTTPEGSKKQMKEALTVAATSTEGSGKSSVTGNCTANISAVATTTAEKRIKDNTKTTSVTAATTDLTDTTSIKDLDNEMEEIPIKSTSAEFAKGDEKNQQSSKLSNSSTKSAQIDDDIAIISLSDGEDGVGQNTPTTIQKGGRKRNSVGATSAEDDQQFRLKRRKIKVAGAPKMPLTGMYPKKNKKTEVKDYGYVRYMNDRRESLRKELPAKTAMEHTKIIGEEWQKMNEDKKAPYMKAAEIDKQRYLAELHTFLKERPDVLACELAKNKQKSKSPGEAGKVVLKEKSQSIGNIKSPNKEANANTAANKDKSRRNSDKDNSPPPPPPQPPIASALDNKPRRKRTPTPPRAGGGGTQNSNSNNNTYTNTTNNISNNHNSTSSNSTTSTTTTANAAITLLSATAVPGEIPIFTNEFLEHNKIFDMELRTVRKSKTDLEQQNAVLEKHVENMKFGVDKLTNENDELAEKNRLLELYLDKLKSKLAHALSGLAIPTQPSGANLDNIEKYMSDLYKMATTNTHGPASLNKAKDIIRKLDLQINL